MNGVKDHIHEKRRKLRDFIESSSIVPGAIAAALRLIHGTCRFTLVGYENFLEAREAGTGIIAAFWHFSFPAVVYFFRDNDLLTIVSPSRDGGLAAGIVRNLGYTPFRGSPGKGGAKALRQFIAAMKGRHGGGFPVDGSQGPARIAQKGILALSHHSGSPLLPVSMAADRCWRLRSWDRTLIAKPFSRIVMAFGPLIRIERGASHEKMEEYRLELEKSLNLLSDQAERLVRDPGLHKQVNIC